MHKIIVVALVIGAFFVGAFVDRQMVTSSGASQVVPAEKARLKKEYDELYAAAELMKKTILELREPYKLRGITEQLTEMNSIRFKLELAKYPQLLYRPLPPTAEGGGYEFAAPVAVVRQEPDGLYLYTNFKDAKQPQKDVRLQFIKEKK